MTTQCPKCKAENPDTKQFCGDCGTQLMPAKETPVPTQTIEAPKEELTTGSTFADRYQIIEELGKGGMGRVYKAHDTKIKEKIALKLIKPEIAKDKKTIERFSNELRLARKIRHKNVCGMFDLGEEKGTHYITMEFVPGEELKSSIRRFGQLPIGKSISIAKQICEGLAEAHRLGVIHRDLKSSNIMIDKEGNARIMDFGIARSLEAKGMTGDGVMIGTPEYMSPEQVEGKEVDERSDIYSLGIILFEMVTGRVPFEGDTPFTIGMKHKGEIPQNPKELNSQISDDLNRLILRCLEKDKQNRYQSAGEVQAELEGIGRGVPTAEREISERKPLTSKEITVTFRMKKYFVPILVVASIVIASIVIWQVFLQKKPPLLPTAQHSIAVLPFADGSPLKDQEYICDGMTDEIIAKLSMLKSWKVISRSSVMHYKNTNKDINQIGQELGVSTILEGSVRREDDQIRVMAQLVNVEDRFQLWSQTYEQKLESVFAIQSAIAEEITKALKTTLSPTDEERLQMQPTENLEAYNLYLQGRFLWNKRTPNDLKKSIEFYEKAIEKDPDFALAYAGIADSYINLSDFMELPPMAAFPNAKKALNKALEINNSLGEAHCSLAYVFYAFEWDFKSAENEFKRAIELNPNYATAHQWYGQYLAAMGRFEEAYKEIDKALELDPLSLIIRYAKAETLYFENRYEESIEQLKMTLEIDDRFLVSLMCLGWNYIAKGMYQEASDITQKALSFYEDNIIFLLNNISIYALSGQREKAKEMFDDLISETSKIYVPSSVKAAGYYFFGEKDKAFEWFERACDEKDTAPAYLKYGFSIESLSSDPRFKTLLKKMNLE
jgi:serine/threonine protein kinase/tetratricopeptide (TPR) repeat protein